MCVCAATYVAILIMMIIEFYADDDAGKINRPSLTWGSEAKFSGTMLSTDK